MAAAAQASGCLLVEAFHYRFHPLAARLVAIIAAGELGEIESIDVHFHIPRFAIGKADIRYNVKGTQPTLAGGAMMDAGCYAVNVCRLLAGAARQHGNRDGVGVAPESASGGAIADATNADAASLDGATADADAIGVTEARAKVVFGDVDESMDATLSFSEGQLVGRVSASMRGSKLGPSFNQVVVNGSKGSLECSNWLAPFLYHYVDIFETAPGGKRRHVRTEKLYGEGDEWAWTTYEHQMRAFVGAVRGDACCLEQVRFGGSPEDGVLNMRCIDEIYRKAGMQPRSGVPVSEVDSSTP